MYFSKIKNPKAIRKQILLTARESILALSNQKKTENIKLKKQETITEITEKMNQIQKQIDKLNKILPNQELKKETETLKRIKKIPQTTQQTPRMTDLDRLDYTLKKIEEKLAKIE
ncbi:hypothetical protein K9L97_01080 [Candidatus Woesearchaeota archaeon]|nr:hypothetical protein [Candidatus Woesearchaeota archaeon]